ncbi:MAG TPA: MOSC domain-containing protein, partial [Chondromyces sp.]|nr:MOSC domain-containing protein [Chondromyces sp.]
DVFQIGEAVVQVSQPRQPCHKLAKKHDIVNLPVRVQDTGYTGFYFRVLREGWMAPDSSIDLIEVHPKRVTVEFANQVMHHEKKNQTAIEKILEVNELSADWRDIFLKRLEKCKEGQRKICK